jgi:hypothetical protein
MLEALSIDLWNEPNGSNFWPGSQDQYLQAWSYAFKKYRDAFGTSVPLQGPASSMAPSLSWDWWTNYANYLSNNRDVIPDVWSYHQLEGRNAANCGNDPVDSRNNLTEVLNKYNLPNDRQVQVNEYGNNDGEQTPAYTSWFLSRFERANSTALRANWGAGRTLHNDLARLLLPSNDGFDGWTAMGDWHVLNYYNKMQSSGRVVQTQSTKSTCYDSFATLDANNRIVRILAGSRGQSGDYPITVNGLNSLGVSSVNAVVKEIPFNNAGTVDSPNLISNGPISVDSNGSITVNLNMVEDSAYTIDLTY